jgi:thioredoxin-like negative regulator of GroEL
MKGCVDRRIGEWIGLYELGALEDGQRALFLDHLVGCEYCYNQVYSLEPVMTAFRNHRSAAMREKGDRPPVFVNEAGFVPPPPARFRMWAPLLAAMSLLVCVFIGAFYLYEREGTHRSAVVSVVPDAEMARVSAWQNLVVPKAAYAAPVDRAVLRKPGSRAFDRAMAAYEENDFAGAIEQLETLRELGPDDAAEVNFYLGVSLLLAGRSQEAARPLRQAAQSGDGSRREDSLYYLALAYLKNNQPDQAAAELDAVIAVGGERQFAAEKLKQQISDFTR